MKILHLASGNRWTGAAAPAFAEVAALREAGIDAHYAYVGGYKLEAKIGRLDFTHALIRKAQNPISFFQSTAALRNLVDHHGFDIVHAHLTWDHLLARTVAADRGLKIARTFHARRVIRRDPFTRLLIGRSDLICVVNDALRDAPPIRDRDPVFSPPPVDLQQFKPEGADVRAQYGIPKNTPLISTIGKLSKDRGFELAIESFARVRQKIGEARLMIIGHGEHRPALEALTKSLDIADSVIWAGYHEDGLADHYRASDILLFAASGSDEGHRAVLEAMACGTVPVTIPLEGMDALLGDLGKRLVASDATPSSVASVILSTLETDLDSLRNHVVGRAEQFSYPHAARRLTKVYTRLL